jgi:hypothetical protein
MFASFPPSRQPGSPAMRSILRRRGPRTAQALPATVRRAAVPSFRSRINRARWSAAAISEKLRYLGWMRGFGLKIAGLKIAR